MFRDSDATDSDLLLTSLVPLQLHTKEKPQSEKTIIWQNPRPSSTRYCRPVRFQFKKETAEVTKEEAAHIENQIAKLLPTQATVSENVVSISHKLLLTMVDGKVCNAITCTKSSQRCLVCGATPKEMNNIDEVLKRTVDPTTFRFGLSVLHAWIRFFECLLHVSYRLDFEKWQRHAPEDKQKAEVKKAAVQREFRSQMGLLVDQPKPGGSGTSNDGNTARRFFANPSLSASITGIDEILIKRFAVILHAISSGFALNTDNFNEYSLNTARMFISTYPWFYMPATVHKILIHGAVIISEACLPIGQLSEEAQEARNKDFKYFREHHTRKLSRIAANQDLLNQLLVSSDPVVSSMRNLPNKHHKKLSLEVLNLLQTPQDLRGVSANESSDEDKSSEESERSD